jgi:hypothetical protein
MNKIMFVWIENQFQLQILKYKLNSESWKFQEKFSENLPCWIRLDKSKKEYHHTHGKHLIQMGDVTPLKHIWKFGAVSKDEIRWGKYKNSGLL